MNTTLRPREFGPLQPSEFDALAMEALRVQSNAYCPYSNFAVGAAVWAPAGQVFAGCNVENASYGLAICAERTAMGAMISAGFKTPLAVAVASRGGVAPCGACRQFLAEFGLEIHVFLIDSEGKAATSTVLLKDLLPRAFSPENLG